MWFLLSCFNGGHTAMSIQVARRLPRIWNQRWLTYQPQLPSLCSGRASKIPTRAGSCILITGLLLGIFVAQPVAAQGSNPVCSDASGTLPSMIEGFIQLTTALGLMGLLVVWQADELAEMFTLSPEQKQKLKGHKRNAMKSAAVLVLLGPVFTVAGDMMGLPVAQCVDLVPF